jgi:PEGA domain
VQSHTRIIWAVGVCLTLAVALWPARADAQWRYPYYVPRDLTALRVIVKPNDAKVYVDGYYAGIVDDFDGVFQRLRLPAGQHDVVLYLDGYRKVHQKIYLTPDSTYKLRYTMEKNLAGETSEAPPEPPETPAGGEAPPGGGQPMPPMPRTPRGGMYPPRQPYPPQQPYPPPQQPPPPEQAPPPPSGRDNGTLVVRVQPAAAEVWIDGEQWRGPDGDERLLVQLAEGAHHVEIRKSGYRSYTTDVQVRRGETVPLNVSLTPDRIER